jgi:rhodanese-related sulfurtransferase
MNIRPVSDLVAEANAQIETIAIDQAAAMLHDDSVQFVDIRDVREVWREGTIPGAQHAPRGMLEFWFDPACKYHRPEFAEDKTYLLFCASAWRSALAAKALTDMGFTNVAHIDGGFSAWVEAGHPVEERSKTK